METSEAAAALLNMESPNNILDEKRMSTLHPAEADNSESAKRLMFSLLSSPLVKFPPTALCWRPT